MSGPRRRVRGMRGQASEPLRCSCNGESHPEHRKPGRGAGAHTDPNCPHSTLALTTRGEKAPRTRRIPGTRGVTEDRS
jgi:hypothetical protein